MVQAQATPSISPAPRGIKQSPAWWLIACLIALGMLAMLDRYVLTLLVAPIKAELRISDTQMGLVVGLAFALANLAISLPAGWLADRADRRSIIAAGVVLWSVTAAACGAAGGFWQLFTARIGVGMGEGLAPPAAYSLIRDAVAPGRRGLAFSAYAMAGSVGAGLSLVLGGLLVGAITASGVRTLPVIGAVSGWRLALSIIGVAGLPMALIAFAFRDPGRRGDVALGASFRETIGLLAGHRAIVLCLALFGVMHAMLTASIAAWAPAILGRKFGLAPQAIGPALGAILMVAAPIGLGASGLLMDRVARTRPTGAGIAAVFASVVLLSSGTLLPRSPSLPLYWVAQAFVVLSSTAYLPVTSIVIAQIVPSRATGKTVSMFLLIQGVMGAGLAPVIVAFASDTLYTGRPGGLAHALGDVDAIYGAVGLLAAAGLYQALGTLKRERLP